MLLVQFLKKILTHATTEHDQCQHSFSRYKKILFSLLYSQSNMLYGTNEKTINGGTSQHLLAKGERRDRYTIKWLIGVQICTTIIILLMVGAFYIVAYSKVKEKTVYINVTNDDCQKKENIVTLYALDPLARTFYFADGEYGQTISDGSVYNRRSDIDFNNYNNGSFSIGIEGNEVGTIIDLGSSADLQRKYKYDETVGNGQGFASIHRKNHTLLIAKNNAYSHVYQVMEESAELFQQGISTASAPVNFGHLYVLRITDQSEPAFERIVKMLVISYKPNESVTIRWKLLP